MKQNLSFEGMAVLALAGLMLCTVPGLALQDSSPSNAPTASILIQNYAFHPATLTVEKGTIVTWLNADRDVYKIKSDKFESKALNRGDAFSYTFNETGTYNYAEASYSSMKGTIVVT